MSTRRSARLGAVVPTTSAADQSDKHPESGTFKAGGAYGPSECHAGDGYKEDEAEDEPRKPKRRKVDAGESRRPARRKPAATARTKSSAPAKKKQGRLEGFMNMPLDVIFEILSCLPYPDFLSLVRASKRVWQILKEPAQATLWKAARADMPNLPVPDPPRGLSEVNWAYLLYGGSGCYSCGAKNVQTIMFGLRRRACARCKKAFMISDVYAGRGPLCEKITLWPAAYVKDLVYADKEQDRRWYSGRHPPPGFWAPDVENLHRHIRKLRSTGGQDAVDEFTKLRAQQIKEGMKAVKSLEEWDAKRKDQVTERRNALQQDNFNKLRSRLLAAGYDSRDILEALKENIFGKKELRTERALSSVQAEMEPLVIAARDKRLEGEAADRKAARTRHAVWLYHQYLKTLIPVQWSYLPRANMSDDNGVCSVPCFKRLIEDARVDIPETEWTAAVDELPQSLSALLVASLSVLEPISDDLPGSPASFELVHQGQTLNPNSLDALCQRFALLDLAQATKHFVLQRGKYSKRHSEPTSGPSSHIIMTTILSFARLMSNKPTATPRELDIACGGIWFKCMGCSAHSDASRLNIAYLGWRSFLQHCARRPDRSHQPGRMPASYAPKNDTPSCKDWLCTHCSAFGTSLASTDSDHSLPHPDSNGIDAFLDMSQPAKCFWNAVTPDEAREHSKLKHGIVNPREHYDYFHVASEELCHTMDVKTYYSSSVS